MDDFLVANGFTKKEAKIYLCILEAGETPISFLARKTGLKRTTAHTTIESLKNKGILFINLKKGTQYISALSPEVLLKTFNQVAEENIKSLQKRIKESEKILPKLLAKKYASPLKPRIRFFEGNEGIKQILKEFSESKIQSMGFTDYEQMPEELLKFIRSEIIPQRRKLKNKAKFIIPNNTVNEIIQSEDNKFFSEHKIIDFPIQKNPIELLLFDNNKIAFVSFVKNETFGLVIESEAIHNSLKNIFNCLWK